MSPGVLVPILATIPKLIRKEMNWIAFLVRLLLQPEQQVVTESDWHTIWEKETRENYGFKDGTGELKTSWIKNPAPRIHIPVI